MFPYTSTLSGQYSLPMGQNRHSLSLGTFLGASFAASLVCPFQAGCIPAGAELTLPGPWLAPPEGGGQALGAGLGLSCRWLNTRAASRTSL